MAKWELTYWGTQGHKDTGTTSGWPVARVIYGEVMGKIERGTLQWEDKDAMWQARIDAKSHLCLWKIQFTMPTPQESQNQSHMQQQGHTSFQQ